MRGIGVLRAQFYRFPEPRVAAPDDKVGKGAGLSDCDRL